ncbi:hypothetical protein PVAP13_9KG392150 [Panicum virgatum]|uniref:Uncharacterized protein n=1 Tax=Panicum virgatum TaxID=38727 RepID=A0A8T0NST1_PANVG|nr:hypothetical protein PVAP13_9KG392150 [Panicum virgatum]
MSVPLTRCCQSLAGILPSSSTSGTTTAPRCCISRPGRGVQMLLENNGIISALTGSYRFPGSTSLHLAARTGNLDCI